MFDYIFILINTMKRNYKQEKSNSKALFVDQSAKLD